ncbi:hypothetical protein CAAN3_01S08944 [[Candida] anglica]
MVFKFTIDNVINQYVPSNQVSRLPKPIARFLGKHSTRPVADYWIWIEICVASFCGIALLEGVFKSHTVFQNHNAPMIIASYGASAILCFNAIGAPLAQPRNVLMGQIISSIVGVCIQKLFSLSEGGRANYWASGALSVGVSSTLMSIFNCVHPPAGASALLPSIDEQIRDMSWWYLPMQIVSSVLIVFVALITGNIIRTYPSYWWSPSPLGKNQGQQESVEEPKSDTSSEREGVTLIPGLKSIELSTTSILVPEEVDLSELEIEWLCTLQNRLKGPLPV